MANRFLKYNSKAEYDAEKNSLPIPYVATYPSTTDGKTVVVYGNADGTNQSEVIATAQLTNLITAVQADMEDMIAVMEDVIAEKDALIQDIEQAVLLERKGYSSIPLLCGQPMILFGAGTPQEAIVPDNWQQFDPETCEGYNWTGVPSAIGQQYINTTATTGGRYIAVRDGYYGLKWLNC